jgi:hypothetical protein
MTTHTGPEPLSGEFLAQEAERTILDYSWAWEGEREHVEQLDGAVLRWLDVPWFGLDGMVVHVKCDPERIDEQLDAIIARSEAGSRQCWWVVGQSGQPADVVERIVAKGFVKSIEWAGLALRDLNAPFPVNPDVIVEPLSATNVDEYAAFCASLATAAVPGGDPRIRPERLAAGQRFIASNDPNAGIYLGRLDGKVASCVVSHIEPTGVMYLRNAVTLPEFRQRGLYLTLVAYRLGVARAAGCRAAVVQAQTRSSAPILIKRGFERVTTIWGLSRPGTESAASA